MSAVAAPPLSPFKGLAAFEDSELDALLFFGRERERQVLLANLLAARLTVLYGDSGVGKSSLLAAAVVRDLRDATDAPIVVRNTWSGEAESVLDEFPDGGEGYLILDQFEEYFLYHDGDDSPLLGELPELLASSRVNVLIALREDALARLDVFKARIPGVFGNQVRLEHLDAAQARAAILGPLARWRELYDDRVDAEPELVDAVIDDVAVDDGRVEAPYLQLVLERVWEAEREAGSPLLRRQTLEALGGATAIVRRQFRGALDALPPGEQDVAAAMFEHLVTPTGTKIALRAADLAEYAHVDDEDARQVLDRLTRNRVVRAVDGSDRYEIFHDVLAEPVSAWRLERQLVAERAAARRQRRRLLAVIAASLLSLAIVAGLALWAFSERSSARAQARHARARELDALALQQLAVEPNKSLRLALAAVSVDTTGAAESVLRESLVADRLRLVRHVGAPVRAAAVSAPAGLIAVGVAGKRVLLLQASNRRLVRTLSTSHIVGAVGFADGGRTLVSASPTGTAETFDAATGRRLPLAHGRVAVRTPGGSVALIAAHGRLRHALAHARRAVTLDGRTVIVATTSPDGHVRPELFRDGALLRVLPQIGVADVTISADGKRVASAGQDGFTNIWNARTGRLVRHLRDAKSGAASVAFSPDGTQLASGGEDSGVRIWNVAEGTRTFLLFGHTNPVERVAWSPDGTVVVSSGADGTILLWRMTGLVGAGSLAATLAGSTGRIDALAFTQDSARVVTGGVDGTLRIWDIAPDPELRVLGQAHGAALAARWSESGPVGLWPHELQTFDEAGRRTHVFHGGVFTALAAAPGARVVAVGSRDGSTDVWDARTGESLSHASGASPVVSVAVSPHGDLVATGRRDGSVVVRVARTGDVRWTRHQAGSVEDLVFSADGAFVAAAGLRGVTLWSADTGRAAHVLDLPNTTRAVFSPDGRYVAAGARDGTGRIWFMRNGRPYRILRGHRRAITSIVFSSDSAVLATAGADSDVRIWNVANGTHFALQRRAFGPLAEVALDPTGRWVAGAAPISVILWSRTSGRQLFYVRGHTGVLTSVSFAPDAETVLTSSRDGTIRTYDCDVCADRDALVHLAKVRLVQTR